MSAFGKAVLVRRQVAGDNGRTKIGSISCAWPNIKREGRTEGCASSEVLGGVGLSRLLAKEVRIVIHQQIEVRRAAPKGAPPARYWVGSVFFGYWPRKYGL